MKWLKWLALIVGTVVLGLWVLRKVRASMGRADPSARDADDIAANKQSDLREAQSLAATPGVRIPMASFVRPNGSILDLNVLGGTIPDLVTVPRLDTLTGSFGYGR